MKLTGRAKFSFGLVADVFHLVYRAGQNPLVNRRPVSCGYRKADRQKSALPRAALGGSLASMARPAPSELSALV
jgi:hypothetical protein